MVSKAYERSINTDLSQVLSACHFLWLCHLEGLMIGWIVL